MRRNTRSLETIILWGEESLMGQGTSCPLAVLCHALGLSGSYPNIESCDWEMVGFPDVKTCNIPVDSSPDPGMLYEFTPTYVFFYEIECLIQDVIRHPQGFDLNVDCLKGGGARWFEKMVIRRIDSKRVSLRSWGRKPSFGESDQQHNIFCIVVQMQK
jgi:hypothetical protein